jgi:hypothetical protein
MSTFFLDDDCGTWAQFGAQSAIGPFLKAGSVLQNSVTLTMDQGGATVQLPLVDHQDKQRAFSPVAPTHPTQMCTKYSTLWLFN